MRRLLALVACLFALVAAAAGGVQFDTATLFTFTDCAAGGSSAQTITAGSYLMTVTDSDVFVCFADSAATCVSNGTKLPLGTVMLVVFGASGKSVACRSSGSTGDVQFTKQIN